MLVLAPSNTLSYTTTYSSSSLVFMKFSLLNFVEISFFHLKVTIPYWEAYLFKDEK